MKRRNSQKILSLPELKSVDNKILQNRVLGRAWAKQHPISVKTYNQVGELNYNSILLHLKDQTKNSQPELTTNGTFNASRYIEKKVLIDLAKFLKLDFDSLSGYITAGGTEANIYAMWVARNWTEKNSPKQVNWLIPKTSHYSFNKAVNLLGLENNPKHQLYYLDKNSEKITDFTTIKQILAKFKKDDFIVIALTAMTTEFGLIDPISETINYLRKNKLKNIFLHIDACFSGFVLPLLKKYQNIFSYPEISSIAVDFHKTFGGPIGSGAIWLNHGLYQYSEVFSSYIQGHADYTLLGSRNGISAVQIYQLWQYKKKSLKKEIKLASEKTTYLYKKLSKLKQINVLYQPFANYLIFSTTIEKEANYQSFVACCNNFSVSSTRDNNQDYYKVIIDHSINKKTIDLFIKEIKKCLKKNTTK